MCHRGQYPCHLVMNVVSAHGFLAQAVREALGKLGSVLSGGALSSGSSRGLSRGP